MESLILFVVCLAIFITQIVLIVKAIKRKEKKYWISNFCIEIFSIIMSIGLIYYYEKLPRSGFMPGLQYLGEELTCLGASILYAIMLCITIIARLIVFAKSQKQQGKKSAIPLILIIAFVLIIMIVASLFYINI